MAELETSFDAELDAAYGIGNATPTDIGDPAIDFSIEPSAREEQDMTYQYLSDAIPENPMPDFAEDAAETLEGRDNLKNDLDFWKHGVMLDMKAHDPEAYEDSEDYIESQLDSELDFVFNAVVGSRDTMGIIDTVNSSAGNFANDFLGFLNEYVSKAEISIGDKLSDIGLETVGGAISDFGAQELEAGEERRQARSGFIDVAFPTSNETQDSTTAQIAGGLTQAVGQIATAAISTPLQVAQVMSQIEAAAQESYEEVLAITGDEGLASDAFYKTMGGSAVAHAGSFVFEKKLGKIFRGKLGGTIKGKFSKLELAKLMGLGGVTESFEELVETSTQKGAIESSLDGDDGFTTELDQFLKRSWEHVDSPESIQAAKVGGAVGLLVPGGVSVAAKATRGAATVNRIAAKSLTKAANRLRRGEDAPIQDEFEAPVINSTERNLELVDENILNLERAIEQGTDKTKNAEYTELLADQKIVRGRIEEDLAQQGEAIPSESDKALRASVKTLETELKQIDTELAAPAVDSEEKIELQKKRTKTEVELEQSKDALSSIQEELELDDADITEKQETRLIEDEAFFSNRVDEKKQELKDIKGELTTEGKDRVKDIKAKETQAEQIKAQINARKDQIGKVEIFKAGDNRVVASTDLNKDVRDFTGALLSAFNISRPLVLASTKSAKDTTFKETTLQEGARTPNPASRQGKVTPTAFTIAEGLENDAVLLNDTELTPRNAEAISHEVGHVVGEDILAKNPDMAAKLKSEYDAEVKGKSFNERGVNQKLPLRQDEDENLSNKAQTRFREWIADNVGRYISNKNLDAKSPVQKFFKDVAQSLTDIYNKLTGNSKLKVNTTLETFLNDHFNDARFNEDRFNAFLENRRETKPKSSTPKAKTKSRKKVASVRSKPGRFKFGQEASVEDAQDADLEAALEQEGLSEEPLSNNADIISSFREESGPFLKGDEDLEFKNSETFKSIMGGKLFSKEAKKNIAKNVDKDYLVQSRAATGNEVENFIRVYGIEDSTDAFFNAGVADPDFRVGLGMQLSTIYDRLAVQANRVGAKDVARSARTVQWNIASELVTTTRNAARALDLAKLLQESGSPIQAQHLIQKMLARISDDLGKSGIELKQSTKDKINGLAEELMDAKRGGLNALSNNISIDMKTEVTKDLHRSNVADVVSQAWYAATLSSADTLIALPGVSFLSNLLTKTIPTAIFDPATRRAVRGAIGDVTQAFVPTLLSSWTDGRISDLQRVGVESAPLDVTKTSKAIYEALLAKENKSFSDRIALGFAALGSGASSLGSQAFRVMNTMDDISQLPNRQLYIRSLTEAMVKKQNANLTAADLRREVSKQLYGTITQDGVTREKTFNDFKAESEKKIKANLSEERAAKMTQSQFDSLVTRETFMAMNEKVDQEVFDQASRLGEEASLMQDVEGPLGFLSVKVQEAVRAGNDFANSRESDVGREAAKIGVLLAKIALVPFNKPLMNFADKSLNYVPFFGQAKNAKRALGKGSIETYTLKGKQIKDLTNADIIEARNAVLAPATIGTVLTLKILSEIELDDEDKMFDITAPGFNMSDSLEEARPSGHVKLFGSWINYEDSILSGYFSAIGSALDSVRKGEAKISPRELGMTPSEAKAKGLIERLGDDISTNKLSRAAQLEYIENHKIALMMTGFGGALTQIGTGTPLGQTSFLSQMMGYNSNENTAAKAVGRSLGKIVSPGIVDDILSVTGSPKISRAPKFKLGTKLMGGGFEGFNMNDQQALAHIINNSPITLAFDTYPARNIIGEEIDRDIPIISRLWKPNTVSPEIQWLANKGIAPKDNILEMTIGTGRDKRQSATITEIIDSRSGLLEKIGAVSGGMFSPREADELQAKYLGPNIKKLINKYMDEDSILSDRAMTIKSFNSDLSAVRRLSKLQLLDKDYASQMGQDIFLSKDEKKLSELLGE